jgi:hypothetical protein
MKSLFAIALMLFALGAASAQETVRADVTAPFIGTWSCVSATINGKNLPEAP